MKNVMTNKLWKRNAVVATVLLFVCVGIYLNWAYQRDANTVDLTEVLNQDLVMDDAALVIGEIDDETMQVAMTDVENSSAEYFAQIRLNRQTSRDSAVADLQETIAYETGSDDAAASAASTALNELVTRSLDEAEIESLVIAKGYEDCVCFMSDEGVSVAVGTGGKGLDEAQVATIADIVLTQSEYELADIRVVEVP